MRVRTFRDGNRNTGTLLWNPELGFLGHCLVEGRVSSLVVLQGTSQPVILAAVLSKFQEGELILRVANLIKEEPWVFAVSGQGLLCDEDVYCMSAISKDKAMAVDLKGRCYVIDDRGKSEETEINVGGAAYSILYSRW
jgi:hypothetical protein